MNIPIYRSLGSKIVFVAVIIQIIMLAFLLFNTIRLVDHEERKNIMTQVSDMKYLLSASLSPQLFNRDYVSLKDTLQQLVTNDSERGLVSIEIYKPDGKLYIRQGVEFSSTVNSLDDIAKLTLDYPYFHASTDLMLGQLSVGRVHYLLSVKSLLLSRSEIFWQGISIAFIEVLLSIILLSLVSYWILRNLNKLVKAVEQLKSASSTVDVNIDSRDEINLLGNRFNEMSRAIRQRSKDLEQEVIQRSKAEENLSITLHSIGDAVIATDTSGNITRMNKVAEGLTHWSSTEAEGKLLTDVFQIINAKTRKPAVSPVSRVLESGLVVELANHTILIAKNGTEYQIADSAAPIQDAEGNISGVVLVFRDVTHEYSMLSELEKSEERFRSLFENAEVSIWNEDFSEIYRALENFRVEGVTDLRHFLYENLEIVWDLSAKVRVVHVNEVTLKMFGADSEATLIEKIDKTFADDSIGVFIEELCAIWNGEDVFRSESGFKTLGGRDLYCIISFLIPKTEEGFKSIPVTILDITSHKSTEEALRRVQKMDAVGQMAGGIAHDFNNILGIIIGNLSFLKRQVVDDEKALHRVNTADKAAQRAADLTRKLLGFSRKQAKEMSSTNINTILENMDTLISRSMTPEVQVEQCLEKQLWMTKIDPGDLEDAVLNLILNARDAMPEGGKLTVETCNSVLDEKYVQSNPTVEPGEYVEFSISDTGKGIKASEIDRVFEPFFTTKHHGKGTGLGLSMVFGFIQRSNGHIKIHSEADISTTIRCYLPRSRDVDHVMEAVESELLPRGSETILVVDDEQELLDLAQQYLVELGYRVKTASNSHQALEALGKYHDISLLFSDVVMPNSMNGYELAEQAVTLYPTLKILLSSGYSSKTLSNNGQTRFRTNLLKKPYNHHQLANRVRHVLDE